MNEANQRIKQLMVQVCKEQGLPFTVEHNRAYMLDNFSEKFAELILQECFQACINEGASYEVGSAGEYSSNLYVTAIKKHFGITQ
jgi:hypothetical protein